MHNKVAASISRSAYPVPTCTVWLPYNIDESAASGPDPTTPEASKSCKASVVVLRKGLGSGGFQGWGGELNWFAVSGFGEEAVRVQGAGLSGFGVRGLRAGGWSRSGLGSGAWGLSVIRGCSFLLFWIEH